MNEVLDADDVVLAQLLLDDVVRSDRYATAIHLGKTTLVDEFTNAL